MKPGSYCIRKDQKKLSKSILFHSSTRFSIVLIWYTLNYYSHRAVVWDRNVDLTWDLLLKCGYNFLRLRYNTLINIQQLKKIIFLTNNLKTTPETFHILPGITKKTNNIFKKFDKFSESHWCNESPDIDVCMGLWHKTLIKEVVWLCLLSDTLQVTFLSRL